MSEGKKYYCFCGSNCKYETMTKEQILAAITQAVETGSVGDCDTGFITKVKETNKGGYVTFWVGTRAQYNALESKAENCIYIMTDDTTGEDIYRALADNQDYMARLVEDLAALEESVANRHQYLTKALSLAYEEIDKCRGVDFSDNVSLTYDFNSSTGEITSCYVDAAEYIYVPMLHMVFFRFGFVFQGAIEKGKWIVLEHSAKDAAAANYIPHKKYTYPITARSDRYFAEYIDNEVWIHALEGIDTADAGTQVIDVSGWYFCDEE